MKLGRWTIPGTNGTNNGNQPQPPVDPYTIPVETTQGHVNEYLHRIADLEGLLSERDRTISGMEYEENLAVRRLLSFADAVAMITGTTRTSKGTPLGNTGAEYTLSDGDNPLLVLRFDAFGNKFTLRPAGTNQHTMSPIEAEISYDGTVDRFTRLALKGYALDVRTANNGESHDAAMDAELREMLTIPVDEPATS